MLAPKSSKKLSRHKAEKPLKQ